MRTRIITHLVPGWVKWDPLLHPTTCETCLKPMVKGDKRHFPCWEHCHRCGLQRGWLCALCNSAEAHRFRKVGRLRRIQHLLRDKEWQKRMAAYLDRHICPSKAENMTYSPDPANRESLKRLFAPSDERRGPRMDKKEPSNTQVLPKPSKPRGEALRPSQRVSAKST